MTKDEKINTYIVTILTAIVANQITGRRKMIALLLRVAGLFLRKIARDLSDVELKIIYTDKICEKEKKAGEAYQKERNVHKRH